MAAPQNMFTSPFAGVLNFQRMRSLIMFTVPANTDRTDNANNAYGIHYCLRKVIDIAHAW